MLADFLVDQTGQTFMKRTLLSMHGEENSSLSDLIFLRPCYCIRSEKIPHTVRASIRHIIMPAIVSLWGHISALKIGR
jgi:hypothetical protein